MNKKGFMIELIAFVVIGIIAVLFFAGMIYGYNQINNLLQGGTLDSAGVNITAASYGFSQLNSGMNGLKLISAVMILGYFLATLICAYFSSKHPLWLFVYILMSIIVIVFSIFISNSYDSMKSNELLGVMVTSFGISNVIISYLPIWTTILGFIGSVLCVIGIYINRGQNAG